MSGNPTSTSPVASLAEASAPARAPVPAAAGERGLSVSQAMSKVMEKARRARYVRTYITVVHRRGDIDGQIMPIEVSTVAPRACMQTAFIPYITAGDPDLATTAAALRLLDALGADVVELGMPFSDPSADGPVIQASAARALAAGATADAVMAMLKEVTPELSCPVVIFCYFSPIAQGGTASFAAAVKEAGAKGLIVPDLPYAETSAFRDEAIKNDIELVLLTTPSTPIERMKEITEASRGFIYLVSIDGVTGARANVNPRVESLLKEIKEVTNKAVAVSFGISTPDHVKQIAEWGADGVIIGSAMVKQLGEAASPEEGLKRLEVYARSLKDALP